MEVIKDVTALYQEKLSIQNVQIINNNGRFAQQDVFHIHYHIVPRKMGDGQNLKWRPHPEYRNRFDVLLDKLK